MKILYNKKYFVRTKVLKYFYFLLPTYFKSNTHPILPLKCPLLPNTYDLYFLLSQIRKLFCERICTWMPFSLPKPHESRRKANGKDSMCRCTSHACILAFPPYKDNKENWWARRLSASPEDRFHSILLQSQLTMPCSVLAWLTETICDLIIKIS